MSQPGMTVPVPLDCDEVVVIGIPAEFHAICRQYNIDPVTALAGFMADAADIGGLGHEGFVQGGSDEQDQAEAYMERRWFYMR
jgi:hypothetical protein